MKLIPGERAGITGRALDVEDGAGRIPRIFGIGICGSPDPSGPRIHPGSLLPSQILPFPASESFCTPPQIQTRQNIHLESPNSYLEFRNSHLESPNFPLQPPNSHLEFPNNPPRGAFFLPFPIPGAESPPRGCWRGQRLGITPGRAKCGAGGSGLGTEEEEEEGEIPGISLGDKPWSVKPGTLGGFWRGPGNSQGLGNPLQLSPMTPIPCFSPVSMENPGFFPSGCPRAAQGLRAQVLLRGQVQRDG